MAIRNLFIRPVIMGTIVSLLCSAQISEAQITNNQPTKFERTPIPVIPTSDVAISLGDSFISGEGAEDFISGDGAANYEGSPPSPLFSPNNGNDIYFCHRSGNALIKVANLPGIDERYNFACSGADPLDLIRRNPDHINADGTNVEPQVRSVRRIARDRDKHIKLIHIGMGANNSINNFSSLLTYCHGLFMVDAASGPAANGVNFSVNVLGGITEVSIAGAEEQFQNAVGNTPDVRAALDRNGCIAQDFYRTSELNQITDEYERGLIRLINVMSNNGYGPNGKDWKLVVQGYATPFAPNPHPSFFRANGKRDTRRRFAGLARERYAAGCPMHWLSLQQGDDMAQMLSNIAQDVVSRLRNQYPDHEIIYMDVENAFNGGRLCETAQSPAGALFNPIWSRRSTDNQIARTIPANPFRPYVIQWQEIIQSCSSGSFARCQDAAHPNEDGHAVMGRCLSETVELSNSPNGPRDVTCIRNANTGAIRVEPFN